MKASTSVNPCICSVRARVEARRKPQTARDVTHREAGTTWRKSRKSGAGDILRGRFRGPPPPAVRYTGRIADRALRTRLISARASAMTSCNRVKSIHRRGGSPGIRSTSHIW
ncbi:hypothetical protein A8V24_21235, partial [Yersinia pestis]